MGKKLVIVESPAKAKTIGRYLGNNYRITASVGHIRDLPSSTLGVDVANDFKPRYITMKGKEKVIHEMKELAEQSDEILLATDPDREGEAIAWHIAQVLGLDVHAPMRISFNEITEPAVKAAVEHPRAIDLNLVNSQQARRILDRLVGYELSPLLWKKIRKGLSAGRVQSVATRMIVEREREIDAFKPEEYHLLTALLSKDGIDENAFKSRYFGEKPDTRIERRRLATGEEVEALLADIKGRPFTVATVKRGSRQKQPGAPFTTSTLQQDASRVLGFTSKRTMSVAQQLYEGIDLPGLGATALVSYIRTDSVRVSQEALDESREFIVQRFGADYLSKSPRQLKNRNAAQDAHEAIRPAHFNLPPEEVRERISFDQYRLYKLVWDKFMASQMAPAAIDTLTVDILAGTHLFRTTGETIRFAGFLVLYGMQAEVQPDPVEKKDGAEEEEEPTSERLPDLNAGDVLHLHKLVPEQKFTQPPPRFTEATLIKALEEQGIGRPSTYAPTISTILDRQYVEKDRKFLVPTELGKVVTGMLEEHFENIVDPKFTAEMEKNLDTVESGECDWIALLHDFYPPFHERIEKTSEQQERIKIAEVKTGESCPECTEGELVIKEGKFGKFIACSRYPECKYTKNVEQSVKGNCPLCGSGLVKRRSRKYGKDFFTCDKQGKDAACPFISWDLPIEGKTCETCGSYMVLKRFRGRAYPRCGNKACPTNQRPAKEAKADDSVSEDTETFAQTDSAAGDASAVASGESPFVMETTGKTVKATTKAKSTATGKTPVKAAKSDLKKAAKATDKSSGKTKSASSKTAASVRRPNLARLNPNLPKPTHPEKPRRQARHRRQRQRRTLQMQPG